MAANISLSPCTTEMPKEITAEPRWTAPSNVLSNLIRCSFINLSTFLKYFTPLASMMMYYVFGSDIP